MLKDGGSNVNSVSTGDIYGRKLRAHAARLVAGMQTQRNIGEAAVQQERISALVRIIDRDVAGADAVVAAGGVAAVVAGMRAHLEVVTVQELGIKALANITDDNDEGSAAVVAAGGLTTIKASMKAHARMAEVQKQGGYALKRIRYSGYHTDYHDGVGEAKLYLIEMAKGLRLDSRRGNGADGGSSGGGSNGGGDGGGTSSGDDGYARGAGGGAAGAGGGSCGGRSGISGSCCGGAEDVGEVDTAEGGAVEDACNDVQLGASVAGVSFDVGSPVWTGAG